MADIDLTKVRELHSHIRWDLSETAYEEDAEGNELPVRMVLIANVELHGNAVIEDGADVETMAQSIVDRMRSQL